MVSHLWILILVSMIVEIYITRLTIIAIAISIVIIAISHKIRNVIFLRKKIVALARI